jgi:tetratricopeptide (TPR) repeat protein
MKTLSLAEAAREIALATRRLTDNERRPYCFVVGAGISYPPVPLASTIERHCFEEAEVIGSAIAPLSEAPIDRYSHWFSLAYPHAVHRQRYLRSLIEGHPISQANLRLAHVLSSRRIATIGITPNFDDFLSRALSLLGQRDHRVCDHPATVEQIDPESTDIQIVHVHGNYWFYDQCNLAAEIGSRAEASRDSAFTMLGLLDRIFANRAPIVIGYSGWEGDVIMTALKRRLSYNRRLPYRMYWFGYSAAAVSVLPEWLVQHPDVYFVLPIDAPTPGRLSGPHRPSLGSVAEEFTERSSLMREAAKIASGEEAALPGVRVLDELIRTLDLEAPAITKDPFQFFADAIRASLAVDDPSDDTSDIYALKSIVSRFEHARETAAEAESLLEKLRNFLRRSRYKEVVKLAEGINAASLDRTQLDEAVRTIVFAASNLEHDDLESAESGYGRATTLLNQLEFDALTEEERLILALSMRGLESVYRALNRFEDALLVCDEAIRRFDADQTLRLQAPLAQIYVERTFVLTDLMRYEEAFEAYHTLYERFKSSTDPDAKVDAAYGLLMIGLSYGEREELELAGEAFTKLIHEFGPTEHDETRGWVISAMVYHAQNLSELGQLTDALAMLNKALDAYADASSPRLTKRRLEVLTNKASVLVALGQTQEAIAALDALIQVGGDEQSREVQQAVASAIIRKVLLLAGTRQFDEAMLVVTAFAQRYGKDEALSNSLLTGLQFLVDGESPPHGIKQFFETVQRVMRAYHG